MPEDCPRDFPAFPAFCSRFPESVANIVVAVIGVQYLASTEAGEELDSKGVKKIPPFVKSENDDIAAERYIYNGHGFRHRQLPKCSRASMLV